MRLLCSFCGLVCVTLAICPQLTFVAVLQQSRRTFHIQFHSSNTAIQHYSNIIQQYSACRHHNLQLPDERSGRDLPPQLLSCSCTHRDQSPLGSSYLLCVLCARRRLNDLPSMQAARAVMRSSFRASSLLCHPSSFSPAAASHRCSSLASLSVRSFASSVPTDKPNPYQPKPASESNTTTAAPTTVQSHSSGAGETAKHSHPSGATPTPDIDPYERLPDSEPYQANWVDFRPNLVEVTVTRNEDGDLIGEWEGEEVIFPDLETSLEWVISTPVDTHLFEEVPIIKECPDDNEQH